jgi:hypothetical protein
MTPSRRALRSVRAVEPVPRRDRPLPPPAQDARRVTVAGSRAGGQGPFFACLDDRGGTDVQHAGGVTHPAGMQRHIHERRFAGPGLARGGIVKQQGAPWACGVSAAVALLALRGLPMADDIGSLAVRTVENLGNHGTS